MPTDDGLPTEAELGRMSRAELADLGARLDGVEVLDEGVEAPEGTPQRRRVRLIVTALTALSGLAAVGFVVVFVAWPWQYDPEADPYRETLSTYYTPMLGATFAIAVLALGAGLVVHAKSVLPRDVATQQRHDGPSSSVAQLTTAARFRQVRDQTGFGRRGMFTGLLAVGGTGVAAIGAVTLLGALVRTPWESGPLSPLLVTGWRSPDGERTYLRVDEGDPESVTLVRPGDVIVGGYMVVFPFRESERGDPDRLSTVVRSADDSVMLVHLRPGTRVTLRAGQEDFHYGDLYAYSRICTHMGCPVGQYEDQTNRIVCPCHQTEFSATEYGLPKYGPAARPLPQLPIDVDPVTGYLYARGDFIEPIGPGFWERRPNA